MTIGHNPLSIASHFLLLLLAIAIVPATRAQSRYLPPPPSPPMQPISQPTQPFEDPNLPNLDHSVNTATLPGNGVPEQELFARMARERSMLRQKKVVAQSAQLLALAQKLNADVAKSNANQLSVPVVKEAEEIEKLAKSIQTKAKNGY